MQANNDGFTESTPCYAEVNSSSEYVHVVFNKKNECSVENGIVDATSSDSNKKRWIFGSVLAIALTFSFFYFFMIIAGITQYAHWNSMKSMPGNFSNILGWDEKIFFNYQRFMFRDAFENILNYFQQYL